MASSTGENYEMREAFARLEQVETRVTKLEESVTRAVGFMIPKVEALLSERNIATSTPNETCSPTAPNETCSPTATLVELAEQGDGETILGLLAENGPNSRSIHQRKANGDTALHVAAGRGHLKATIVLLTVINVDSPGHRLRTPLHCAAAHGHVRVLQRLLDTGAKVDVKDADGKTALLLAVEENYAHVVLSLLKKGSKPNDTMLFLSAVEGHAEIVQLLLQNGVSVDACNAEGDPLLVQVARAGRWEMIDMLLTKGVSVTKCRKPEECALVLAAKDGQAEVVVKFLKNGASSNSQQVKTAVGEAKSATVVWAFLEVVPESIQGDTGKWGVREAALQGRLEPLQTLLDLGIDIKYKDNTGETLLHLAARNGHGACVSELIRREADINAKDSSGNVPLHAAARFDMEECVRILVAAGANVTEKNYQGKTPIEEAKSEAVRQAFNINN